MPWNRLESLIEPFYPKAEGARILNCDVSYSLYAAVVEPE